MSSSTNPYQSTKSAAQSTTRRSLVLLILNVTSALSLLILVPLARKVLIRFFEEFEVSLPAFSVLVIRFYPEVLALPLLMATLVIEFVVPNAVAKNQCNVVFLAINLCLLLLISFGFAIPWLQTVQELSQ